MHQFNVDLGEKMPDEFQGIILNAFVDVLVLVGKPANSNSEASGCRVYHLLVARLHCSNNVCEPITSFTVCSVKDFLDESGASEEQLY
jgi:hypothetical protein